MSFFGFVPLREMVKVIDTDKNLTVFHEFHVYLFVSAQENAIGFLSLCFYTWNKFKNNYMVVLLWAPFVDMFIGWFWHLNLNVMKYYLATVIEILL